ncbi:MAG: dihydropteroate synthase [Candidatus Omnitrophica bacterium]|nr:dihydropteroate synthase [Candidatus Omnitrophota bacterium]
MLVIGELINGMFRDVAKAIQNREVDIIQHLAEEQVNAGADALDINTGPYSKDPKADMKWLVESIQKATNVSLCLDSTRADVIEEGLKAVKSRAIINSTSADVEKMETIFALVKKHKAQVIGIAMDKSGVPNDKAKRIELASRIVAKAMDFGIASEDLFLDPILFPVNVGQEQEKEILESIREFRQLCTPAPNTLVGLSNISQGTNTRSLLNRTFLTMAVANGLTAAILDPLDKELMNALITAELILNKNIYCDSFLEAYRKR